jgi:hypothetical protein
MEMMIGDLQKGAGELWPEQFRDQDAYDHLIRLYANEHQ